MLVSPPPGEEPEFRYVGGEVRVILNQGDVCGDYDCLDADDFALSFIIRDATGWSIEDVLEHGRAMFWEAEGVE